MAQLTIDLPEQLARQLESLASERHKSVEQLALEGIELLVPLRGSPAALLAAMRLPPHLSAEDIDELRVAIASGRSPVREGERKV